VSATIEFVRASRWYGPVIALNDVTTSLGPGVTGLLGPNGAGKSTFLKLSAGQLSPSQGEVRVLGLPAWNSPELFHNVGLCPETDAFWERLTARQFLTGLLQLTGFDAAESRRRGDAALAEVALLEAADRRLGGFSKGMRQRVKLAQSIAHDPQVLLLDEPLTGMDPLNRRRVADLIKRLGREGKTVLMSTHILHEVEAVTRRVLLIQNGRILAEGDVREIRDLMDEHPHTVALRARDPRCLARSLVGAPHVLSLTFGAEGEWLTVQTARPDEFYSALHGTAIEAGVSEMYSPDEDLEAVFRYLVPRG
jgi:ABC-2 type transport system ATP-binding protein